MQYLTYDTVVIEVELLRVQHEQNGEYCTDLFLYYRNITDGRQDISNTLKFNKAPIQ